MFHKNEKLCVSYRKENLASSFFITEMEVYLLDVYMFHLKKRLYLLYITVWLCSKHKKNYRIVVYDSLNKMLEIIVPYL